MFCSSREFINGEFPSFGDRYCHKELLTMGCEINLESLLYQMYYIPSIPLFVEIQCLH